MDKEDAGSMCVVKHYAAISNREILPFAAAWMGVEDIMLSELSQTEKDKHDLAHMWNLNKTNE